MKEQKTIPGIEPGNKTAQAIEDLKRQKQTPREHIPVGLGPGDLFSGKSKQRELF